jgi:hypothetical protein
MGCQQLELFGVELPGNVRTLSEVPRREKAAGKTVVDRRGTFDKVV